MIAYLDDIVSNAAKRYPHNIAIIEAGRRTKSVTYKELERRVIALSGYLVRKGLRKGERVGILSKNSITSAALYFAVSRAGGIIIPLNHALDPSGIIERANHCAISALYAGKEFKKQAKEIADNVKSVRFVVKNIGYPAALKKARETSTGSPVSIIYTSGTTGEPLGVTLSHKNLISNSLSIVKYLNLTSRDSVCCVLPFYYIYGLSLLFSYFLAGGTIVINNRFMYPNLVLDSIDKYKATAFAGVSSHYAIMLYMSTLKKRRLRGLKYFMQAGDKMPPHITMELTEALPDKKLYIMYGQTEASPRLTYLNPDLVKRKPDSIGRAIPGVEIKVVNKQGAECRAGQEGEIVASGDNIMLGYWNNDSETAKVIKKRRLYTGDIAFKDSDGDLFIVGRKKDFIKVGANRINPLKIEQLMTEDSRIMEAAAIGVPDRVLGTRIKIFVTLVPGGKAGHKDIIRFCSGRLPSYVRPCDITILKAMPKNSYGKIDRKKLEAM
ncbi:MAG: acyl--CoA ligase [Candidatus Omnitrophica bacterium]|nr:acyl--CoA ligase [Candidatus Omnitrophota bacterium]MBU4488057.1 acyl--CoA ligase [Candidatus Omnitrophota bacterium]MCG2704848.1 acyl--CoA ligase [Candidatus Omnitrophota bacterium]